MCVLCFCYVPCNVAWPECALKIQFLKVSDFYILSEIDWVMEDLVTFTEWLKDCEVCIVDSPLLWKLPIMNLIFMIQKVRGFISNWSEYLMITFIFFATYDVSNYGRTFPYIACLSKHGFLCVKRKHLTADALLWIHYSGMNTIKSFIKYFSMKLLLVKNYLHYFRYIVIHIIIQSCLNIV